MLSSHIERSTKIIRSLSRQNEELIKQNDELEERSKFLAEECKKLCAELAKYKRPRDEMGRFTK